MSVRRDDIGRDVLSGWLVRLLLTAIVLRAMIPVGFMPDFSAASKGVFKVVICSAAGSQHVTLDADGNKVPDQNAGHHDQPCAFSGFIAVALPAIDAVVIAAPEFQPEVMIAPLAVVLPPTRAGPVLGSRGPPQLS